MADRAIQMKEYNGSEWEKLFPKTTADQVGTTTEKQFVSDTEKTTWNAKLDANTYTAADVLAKLKTADGAGSGLDADLLDGKEAAAFALVTDLANYLSKSGGTLTGDLTLKGDPTSALMAVTKQYVDGLLQGLTIKASCKVATTANITLSGTQTIDGVAVAAGDRVLVKDQTTASANGIYIVASGAWTRASDADTTSEMRSMFTFIEQGTTNADSGWVLTTDSITLGTTPLIYSQFSGAGSITVGIGLTKLGNTISIANTVTAGTGIKVTYNAQGQITAVSALAAGDIPNLDMAKISTGNLAATRITQDASNRFVTDTEKSTWNSKAGTAVATASTNGLMSKEDKSKLDTMSATYSGLNAPSSAKTGDFWFDYNN